MLAAGAAVMLVAISLFVSGLMTFSPVGILNTLAIWGPYRLIPDIAYAEGGRHSLDVYAPISRQIAAPVVVFILWR
jgi:hypothetical protein